MKKTILSVLIALSALAAQAQILQFGTLTPFTNRCDGSVAAGGTLGGRTNAAAMAAARATTEGIDILPGSITTFFVQTHMESNNVNTQVTLKFSDAMNRTNSRPMYPASAQPFAFTQTLTLLESNRNILTFSVTNILARKIFLDGYSTTNAGPIVFDRIDYGFIPITSSRNQ